jgi:hypothetical protein
MKKTKDILRTELWFGSIGMVVDRCLKTMGESGENPLPLSGKTEVSVALDRLRREVLDMKHRALRALDELEEAKRAYLSEIESSKTLHGTVKELMAQRQDLYDCLAGYNPEIWGIYARKGG